MARSIASLALLLVGLISAVGLFRMWNPTGSVGVYDSVPISSPCDAQSYCKDNHAIAFVCDGGEQVVQCPTRTECLSTGSPREPKVSACIYR
ncbi:hypothetical protein HY641_04390 [Candidatus Woesearchaeota archaeon]|nr:hypothetical protein [Candidatus Woesearchaeota archaeon]